MHFIKLSLSKNSIFLLILSLTLLGACSSKGSKGSNGGNNTEPSIIKAVIISPSIAKLKRNITISAAGSSSTGTNTLTYDWKIVDEPSSVAGQINTPSSRAAKLYATVEGEYRIKLTVSDGTASDTAEKTIQIDLDGDGVLSANDVDKDGDGILNDDDEFPENITEWVDSDKDGIGNYSQLDEDKDGVNDELDDFPFDASKSTLPVFNESEFNGNLYPDGNNIGSTYPFNVSGSIESGATYEIDVDYYLFEASSGDLITIFLRSNASNFIPTLSLLDNVGASLATVKTNISGAGVYAVSARIPANGTYAFTVSELNNKVSSDYTYTVSVFKDSDIDGLSDEKELAMGMISTTPDSDHDGLSDGYEFYVAQNNFDSDSDLLPIWWDEDSDNDGIDDKIETGADVDKDGLPNFLDLDSDGNTIDDLIEFGIDPTTPLDTDGDKILDFVDLDDDSDGLLDINDSERLVKAVSARLSDKTNRLVVLSATTELASSGKQIRNIARIGDSITISGEGFGADPLVLWEHAKGVKNIKPDSSSDTKVKFTVPQDAGTGRLKVSNGEKISGFLNIKVVETNNPLVFSIATASGNSYATPNETLTIEGKNFTGSSINVSFDGIAQPAIIISDTLLQVVVPLDASSGNLLVIGSGTSNPIALEVRQGTSGTVTLPTASSLALTDLTVKFTGSSESVVSADGSFALATRNQGATSITIFAPEKTDHTPAVFLAATVLPGQAQVEMNPLSTAVDLIYSAMGLEASIHEEDQAKALNILENAVTGFGNFLDQKLGSDAYYLEDYQKDEFVTEYMAAIEDAGKAFDTAIANGTIRHAENGTASKQQFRLEKSASSGGAKVLPKEKQDDYSVKLKSSGDTYSGFINIENDTMLFADFKATNAYNGNIVRDYVNGYFSSNLLGPQRGIFALYWGNDIDLDLKYRSVNIVIYTPGLQGMNSWNEYYNSPSFKLAIRTLLSQAVVPVINSVVGVKFNDSSTNRVLNILFDYGVFDGLEIWGTNPSTSGFADGVGKIIRRFIDPRELILEKVVQSLVTDGSLTQKAISELAVKLGLKLTPWGAPATAISVGGTVIDLGKLAVDVGTTHSQIKYKVTFPISVESVEPSVVINNDEPKEIKLQGNGLGPIVRGSIFGNSVHYPSVEFVDAAGKSYTDTNPQYESYFIAPGSTPPRSPLKVILPVAYLKDAESPLSVILHHYLVDEDVFSDDLVVVDLDTQHTIELVDRLTISSISPNKGAWGDMITVSGAGFSEIITDNRMYFTGSDGSALTSTIISSTATELQVIVPRGADTGTVWVTVQDSGQTQESNKVLFTLEQQNYTFTFGDNGNLNDDTFALYIDGQLVRTMPAPTRTESIELPLTAGRHTAELHGITAPDAIGTYYIRFPNGITAVSGDSISGNDLTAGRVKSWVLDVQAVSNKRLQQPKEMPTIMWKE